jgi:Na+-translocating ferredoxin:NAD+ oxidoreductase subunit D
MSRQSSPHMLSGNTVSNMMLSVLIALIPAIIVSTWLLGTGIILNIILCVTTAIIAETLMLSLRHRPIIPFLSDYSAIITAVLLALCLPAVCQWWIPVIGTGFAIIIAKHLYGGLGYNPFNPAMIGYVVLLISFPTEMTTWIIPTATSQLSFAETIQFVFSGTLPVNSTIDSLSGATPLDITRTQLVLGQPLENVNTLPSFIASSNTWIWINLSYLLAGIWLIYKKVIGWQIPASMICGLGMVATLFCGIQPEQFNSPFMHLFTGATMIAAFFIATDPVTAATTPRGRLYYGFSIGLIIYIIRTWGGYPDGVAFSVLLMNMAAPLIDQYTQPAVYGEQK